MRPDVLAHAGRVRRVAELMETAGDDAIIVRRSDLRAVALGQSVERMRRGEPAVPMMPGQAVAQAKRLREEGLTYAMIAAVMLRYHGVDWPAWKWRKALRAEGVPAAPRGNGDENFRR